MDDVILESVSLGLFGYYYMENVSLGFGLGLVMESVSLVFVVYVSNVLVVL